ncbi:class E sortase [Streptomyces sp. NPDC058011]|uniref:class E sortase n=1 Tax=Streptomyces sp. NPDC058011 TaxID=3346305 RepID=UPI0036EFD56D
MWRQERDRRRRPWRGGGRGRRLLATRRPRSLPARSARNLFARGLWVSAEVVVTFGVVLLLLVVHQLWWTNREARQEAGRTVEALQREWSLPVPVADVADDPLVPEPAPPSTPPADKPTPAPTPRRDQDHAYAVLRIPRIALTVPVAEGTSKGGVLDRGYVGHYTRTAQAGRAGNFALAGHRNTHGEPFRRIDRLRAGDRITVETRDAVYTYTVDKTLARTAPSDSGVIAPVPRSDITTSAGYSEPGYYLTLTTCTPEFSSRYRLVVWAELTAMRPR